MGGEGSGRPPGVAGILAKFQPQVPINSNDMFIPNYSGVQAAALKSAAALGTGGGGHVIQDEGSGAMPQRTNLNFTGTGVAATDNLGTDSTDITINAGGTESDPIFMSLSGSMYNKYLSQSFSGSLPYLPMTLSGSMYDKYLGQQFSGSLATYALSGGATVSLGTHASTNSIHNLSGSLIAVLAASGSTILSGSYVDIHVPYNCNVQTATILPNTSGSLRVAITKATYANYPTLSAFKDYSLTTNTKYQTADTGAIAAGDIVRIMASGASTACAQATVSLLVTKS